MKVQAFLYAFQNGAVREIDIPDDVIPEGADDEILLALAFKYGQNDFQPVRGRCSVSVNDVVELRPGVAFRCLNVGWEEAT